MISADLISSELIILAHLKIEPMENGAYGGSYETNSDLKRVIELTERYAEELDQNLLKHSSDTMSEIRDMGISVRMQDGTIITPKLLMVMKNGKIWFREKLRRDQ